MENTRRSVLAEALEEKTRLLEMVSRTGSGLVARKGFEKEFDSLKEQCRILRELIQALEYEPVKAAIAEFLGMKNWQKEAEAGEKQTGLFRPEAGGNYQMVPPEEKKPRRRWRSLEDLYGHPKRDGADYPERRGVSGGENYDERGFTVE